MKPDQSHVNTFQTLCSNAGALYQGTILAITQGGVIASVTATWLEGGVITSITATRLGGMGWQYHPPERKFVAGAEIVEDAAQGML